MPVRWLETDFIHRVAYRISGSHASVILIRSLPALISRNFSSRETPRELPVCPSGLSTTRLSTIGMADNSAAWKNNDFLDGASIKVAPRARCKKQSIDMPVDACGEIRVLSIAINRCNEKGRYGYRAE